ncbi:MAG: cell division protein MukB [Oscillospiraceae bacterium]|nr:cell division protein MukB [Oscillospiraceae bacterium]
MKKLTKILLVNWLFFSKQVIEVDTISFITGKNGAGKSAIVDALQIVLLGELNSRNFNRAANERAQRTLDGYLRADRDAGNTKSRRGKDFSSYIACQYLDDQSGAQFVCGIVFDCRNDGTRREQFFIYNGVIPEDCYLVDKEAMDIATFRAYLKGIPDAREIFYDSARRYRDDLLAKWNVHNEQVCKMLKKAVSYEHIDDIQKFITENICDIPEKPNIESMQQNIRDYKRHEQLAQREENKLEFLREISKQYHNLQTALDKFQSQRFLILWSEINVLKNEIDEKNKKKQDCIDSINEEIERYDELEREIERQDQRKNELIADRANSDVAQEEIRLREQKNALISEEKILSEKIDHMALELRREVQILCSLSEDISSWDKTDLLSSLQITANTLYVACTPFVSCSSDIFSGSQEPFESIREAVSIFSSQLRQAAFDMAELIRQLNEDLEENNEVLMKLRNNIKDYPRQLLSLKGGLEERLSAKQGQPVHVHILADVLEIAEGQEDWRGAVEGYLNTQKLYLLVEPMYYPEALKIFDEFKGDFGTRSFGLVDIGKLRENERLDIREDSLASKVQTDNSLARSYVDYLLGRVICVNQISELRNHPTAITAQGMLYQGYVARPIPQSLMDDAFIGRKAIELRIARLEKSIEEIQSNVAINLPIHNSLISSQNREFLINRRFVQEAEQRQSDYLRTLEIKLEYEIVDEKLSQLDMFWLANLDAQIKDLEDELVQLRDRKEKSNANKALRENELYVLEYESLPEKYQELGEKEDNFNESFTSQYRDDIGIPRYELEINRLINPATIFQNFSRSIVSSQNEVENAQSQLFLKRLEYVREFQPCSFKVDATDNEEFDAERLALEESELPAYREKIKFARESALEQFQNDFLSKLKSSIDQVTDQVKNLNRALEIASFATDKYRFIIGRNPDEAEFYDMIMSPDLMEGDGGLFAMPFQQKYGQLIEDLFSRIATSDDNQLNARMQSELQQNIERYTDFRTYLKFDLEATDKNGNKELLSQTMNTRSGGETQQPFYVAVLASFAQLYRVTDKSSFGNTVRLVVFDEAFNKMDSNRIIESIRLLRTMGLQAIICAPPNKLPDIMPEADVTLLAFNENYTMQTLPYSKEIADTWSVE